jgi:hypothetical protein
MVVKQRTWLNLICLTSRWIGPGMLGEFGVAVACSGWIRGQGVEWPRPISSRALGGQDIQKGDCDEKRTGGT